MKARRSIRRCPKEPNYQAPKGLCVWCGEPIESKRARWHGDCVRFYRIANFQGDAQKALRRRDRGVCAKCGSTPLERQEAAAGSGRYDYGWCADHIVPLWKVDRSAPDVLKYWSLENLQTLCEPCHKVKTREEAAERAALKRAAGLGVNRAGASF